MVKNYKFTKDNQDRGSQDDDELLQSSADESNNDAEAMDED